MRVLVCGSRDWSDRALLERVLDDVLEELRTSWGEDPIIVEGEARGADRMAREWAEARGLDVAGYPAEWQRFGRRAGHRRNAEMLASGVDLVVAFSTSWPATPGTRGMCRLAYDAGVPVCFVTPNGRERRFYNDRWSVAP